MDAKLDVTLCAASEAPGAKEYVDFQKALSDKLKGSKLERKGEVPDGIPVKSTTVLHAGAASAAAEIRSQGGGTIRGAYSGGES